METIPSDLLNELLDALRFYGDASTYEYDGCAPDDCRPCLPIADEDRYGDRARALIEKLSH